MANRKITFHILKFLKNPGQNVYLDFDFQGFVDWFSLVSNEDKLMHLTGNKFTSLDFIESVPSHQHQGYVKAYFGMMSTGNFGSRRHLKNSINNAKRDNPKEIHEGEEQENYFILGFTNGGEIDLIFQYAGRGIKSLHLKNYFESYFAKFLTSLRLSKDFRIIEGAVVSTVDVMIDRLDRVIKTRLYIDKSILGDDGLGITDRIVSARENLILDVRAERNQDIRDLLADVRQNIVYNTKIDKIWVEGKDAFGNISSFYLNQIAKSTFITIDVDPGTAALVKDDMRRELVNLL